MKRFAARFATTTLLILSAVAGSAMAQERIDTRQVKQEKRIDQGVKSGSLTDQEAQRLEKQQGHVGKVENKAMADGKVTGKERAHVEHAQDKASQHINRQKSDRQHDYNHDGKNDKRDRHEHHRK